MERLYFMAQGAGSVLLAPFKKGGDGQMAKGRRFYVTMTDRFMSGWGMAEGLINKLVFECDSYDEALVVAENAESRGDMSYINIVDRKPWYNPNRYYVQFKNKRNSSAWYKDRNW